MSEKEQIAQLDNELNNLVERFRKEYDLSYASVIGTLQMKVMGLYAEAVADESG